MTYDVQERLSAAVIQACAFVPFFAPAISYMRRLEMPEEQKAIMPTMATDGKNLYFAPEFVLENPINELAGVIVHEALHCLSLHPYRLDTKNHKVWNYATDYAVNLALEELFEFISKRKSHVSRVPALPSNRLYNDKHKGKTADDIYYELMKDITNGKGMDDDPSTHGMWGKDPGQGAGGKSKKEIEETMKSLASKMYHSMKKEYGTVPGCIESMFQEITKPKKNWIVEFEEFIEPEPDDYGYSPADRRFDFDFMLPSLSDGDTGNVKNGYFFFDSSGSVSDAEESEFASEVVGAIAQFKNKLRGYFGFFDMHVREVLPFESKQDILSRKIEGRGGTSFGCVFDWMKEHQAFNDAAFIVIFTDGECDYPKPDVACNVPVLWVFTPSYRKDAPWGRSIHLD